MVATQLAGCGSIGTANVDPSYQPGANGLLVASLTRSGYDPGTLWIQVVSAGEVAQTVASIPVNDPSYGLDWGASDPGGVGTVGRVAVVELNPGEYELRRWVVNTPNRQAFTSVRPLGYRFTIEAGKATYVGNLHLDLQRSASEHRIPFAARLEDQRDRDLAILHRKYRGIRPGQVVFAVKGARNAPLAGSPRTAEPAPTRLDDLQQLLPSR
jgi:hypothetical protein